MPETKIRVDAVMGEIERDVRTRLRQHLIKRGGAGRVSGRGDFRSGALGAGPRRGRAERRRGAPAGAARHRRRVAAADPPRAHDPPAGGRAVHPVREAADPAADDALAVRVQPGQFPPPGSPQPGAVRLHRGTGDRERPPAPRRAWRERPGPSRSREAGVRHPSLRRRHRRRIRRALPAHRRAPRPAARRHGDHDLRARSRHLGQPLSAGRVAGRPAARAAVPGRAPAAAAPVHGPERPGLRRPRLRAGAGAVVPGERSRFARTCSRTCAATAREFDRVLFWSYRYADAYFGAAARRRSRRARPDRRRGSADPRGRARGVLPPAGRLPVSDAGGRSARGDARAGGHAVRGHRLRARSGGRWRGPVARRRRSGSPIRSCSISGASIRTKGARR